MAVAAADPSREQRAARGSADLLRSHVLAMVIFTVAIAAGMGLFLAGGNTVVLIPAVAVALLGAGLVASRVKDAVRVSNDWLAPLGLETTAVPRVVYHTHRSGHEVEGPTVMSGQRHGHAVEVRLDVKRYETVVDGTYPEFTVTSGASGLHASAGAPPPVADVIAPLEGERWTGLSLTAGPTGIRVRRKVRSSDAKNVLWLTDLWLAERLSAELDG